MFTGSDTLPPLGSNGNPLPLQLADVTAGDGMLNCGGGVSGTLQVREVGQFLFGSAWCMEAMKWQ